MHILAMRANALDSIVPRPEGTTGMVIDAALPDLIIQEDLWIGPRALLEQDERFRQIIPLAIMMRENGDILLYRRTNKGGEGRLHGKASFTFGGHMDLDDIIQSSTSGDIALGGSMALCCRRELMEELASSDSLRFAKMLAKDKHWLIIDDTDAVGRVHIGAIHFFNCSDDFANTIAAGEDHIELLGWYSLEKLQELAGQPECEMESWSRMLARCQLW